MTRKYPPCVRTLCLLALLIVPLGMQPAREIHASSAARHRIQPLATLLNADGSLDLTTGFRGALDPAGWRLTYGPEGAPHWDRVSWYPLGPGLNASVHDLEVVGPDVYAAGDFSNAGGHDRADGIARWGGVIPGIYLPLVVR